MSDALNLHSLDTRLVLFCSNHEQGLPSQLWKVAKQWKTHKESLRVTMAMYILGQIRQRAEALHLRAQTEDLEEPESTHVADQESVELPALGRPGEETHVQCGRRAGGACAGDQEHRPPAPAPSPKQCVAPLPFPPTSHRDLGCTGDRIHHGRWPEGRVRTGGLHTPPHSVPAVGDTDCVNEPPDKLQRSSLANHIQAQLAKLSDK